MIRAGDASSTTLKLRWTISSQAALKPFGCPRDQLNQHIVPNIAFHIQTFASMADLMLADLLNHGPLLCNLGLRLKRRRSNSGSQGYHRSVPVRAQAAQQRR